MSKKIKINIIVLCGLLYTLSLLPAKQNFMCFISIILYATLISLVYHLKIFKTTTLCLYLEMLMTSVISLILFQFNVYFAHAFYLMIIFLVLFIALILEAKGRKKSLRKIFFFVLTGLVLFLALRECFIKSSLRIRKEKFTQQYQNQIQE